MGRIFEKRKHKMFARFDRMAKAFTRIGKDIAIAAKQGGADPTTNSKLRTAIQNGKGVNMPKERIDAAIKRAISKDEKGLEEIVYEGYGPFGVAIVVECATDNNTRTVANVRLHFSRGNGALGKTGSLDFIFDRKGVFKIEKANLNLDELELDLIDAGADDITEDEELYYIYTQFQSFGTMQKFLEEKKITVQSALMERIPNNLKELSEDQAKEVLELVETIEADEDVQHVYHNLA